jgi:hypothetical protein
VSSRRYSLTSSLQTGGATTRRNGCVTMCRA